MCFMKSGWVSKSKVQLPSQFQLEHDASSRSVELGYLSFIIFTIMDSYSEATFYPSYSPRKSHPPIIKVKMKFRLRLLSFWTFNLFLSSYFCAHSVTKQCYHELLRQAEITRLRNSLLVIWFNASSLNVLYWFIETVFSVLDT